MAAGDGRLSRTSNTIAWISVCLSIIVMIVAIAVVAGFKSEIRGRVGGFMGSIMLVQPGLSPINELFPFSEEISYLDPIRKVDGVESVSGVAWRSGLIKTEKNIDGLYFKGVDSLYDFSFFDHCLVEGTVPSYSGRISNDIMLSRMTARKLGFSAGDDVTVYFVGDEIKVRRFRLCGIYDAGFEEIDSRMAVADRRQVQRLNGWDSDQVSAIEVRTKADANLDALDDTLENIIVSTVSEDDTSLFVTDIRRLYGHLFDWLNLLDLNVLMVLVLMILVAGFNMISAILIILFEQISTIGLLNTKAKNVQLPKTDYKVFIREGKASAEGLGTIMGGRVKVAPQSALVLSGPLVP